MDSIFEAIGEAIASFLADPVVALVLRLIAGYVVVLWIAAALWAFVDMRRRTTSLVFAYGSASMVILSTPLLFPAALLVHLVLRPSSLASERQLDDLRHTAIALDAEPRCEGCRGLIEEDWLVCPQCRRQLAHRCASCGGTVGLDWSACGWCAADLEGTDDWSLQRRQA